MQIILGGIYGALVGILIVIPVDLVTANAFLNPVGPDPVWAYPTRMAIDLAIVVVGATLGALRGWQKRNAK